MITWIVLLSFVVSLIVFVGNIYAREKSRDARLIQIRDQLRDKKLECFIKKKQRIALKDSA